MNEQESKVNETENTQSERLVVEHEMVEESMEVAVDEGISGAGGPSSEVDYTISEPETGRDEAMGNPTLEVRGISINPLSSGYMVKVGCQSVAVESTETLIDMLNKYLTDPSEFERKWYSNNVRNRLDNIK